MGRTGKMLEDTKIPRVQPFKMRVTPQESEIVIELLKENGGEELFNGGYGMFLYFYPNGDIVKNDETTRAERVFEKEDLPLLTFAQFQSLYLKPKTLDFSYGENAGTGLYITGDVVMSGEVKEKEWKPKQGEMVSVKRMTYAPEDWYDGCFIGMDGVLFICYMKSSNRYLSYTHCKPLPKLPILTHAELVEKVGYEFEYKEVNDG